jgi:hypothetical protein
MAVISITNSIAIKFEITGIIIAVDVVVINLNVSRVEILDSIIVIIYMVNEIIADIRVFIFPGGLFNSPLYRLVNLISSVRFTSVYFLKHSRGLWNIGMIIISTNTHGNAINRNVPESFTGLPNISNKSGIA